MNLCSPNTYLFEMVLHINEQLFILSKSPFIFVLSKPQVVGLIFSKCFSIHSLGFKLL
jgi:hypothetical protein